ASTLTEHTPWGTVNSPGPGLVKFDVSAPAEGSPAVNPSTQPMVPTAAASGQRRRDTSCPSTRHARTGETLSGRRCLGHGRRLGQQCGWRVGAALVDRDAFHRLDVLVVAVHDAGEVRVARDRVVLRAANPRVRRVEDVRRRVNGEVLEEQVPGAGRGVLDAGVV